jgi:hypothetical protein
MSMKTKIRRSKPPQSEVTLNFVKKKKTYALGYHVHHWARHDSRLAPFYSVNEPLVSRGTDTQRYDIVNTVVLLYQPLLPSLHVSVHRTIIR